MNNSYLSIVMIASVHASQVAPDQKSPHILLAQGLASKPVRIECDIEEKLLLEEVKIGCTLAMLLCLDRKHRLAYILGEIIALDHSEAALVLDITQAAFRKQLSRAGQGILSSMTSYCGLVKPTNACRCTKRLETAINLGRVDPHHLLFTESLSKARQFQAVLEKIRQLEETRRVAALYRSHSIPVPSQKFVSWLRDLITETAATGFEFRT